MFISKSEFLCIFIITAMLVAGLGYMDYQKRISRSESQLTLSELECIYEGGHCH